MNDFFEKNIQPKVDNLLAQLKLEPNNIQLLLEIGEIYHNFHNFDLSKKFFRQVVKIDPSSYEAYYYLGCAGKFYFPYLYKAIKLSKEQGDEVFARKILDDISEHYLWLGWDYSDRHEYDKSVRCFKTATKFNPNYTDAYNALGDYFLFIKKDRYTAKEYYQKSIEITRIVESSREDITYWAQHDTRPYMRALHGLGVCNFHLGSKYEVALLKESLNIFKKLLKLNPNDNQGVHYLIPDVYHKMQKYEHAIKASLKIINRENVWHDCLFFNMALAYYKLGDFETAEYCFRYGIRGVRLINNNTLNEYDWRVILQRRSFDKILRPL